MTGITVQNVWRTSWESTIGGSYMLKADTAGLVWTHVFTELLVLDKIPRWEIISLTQDFHFQHDNKIRSLQGIVVKVSIRSEKYVHRSYPIFSWQNYAHSKLRKSGYATKKMQTIHLFLIFTSLCNKAAGLIVALYKLHEDHSSKCKRSSQEHLRIWEEPLLCMISIHSFTYPQPKNIKWGEKPRNVNFQVVLPELVIRWNRDYSICRIHYYLRFLACAEGMHPLQIPWSYCNLVPYWQRGENAISCSHAWEWDKQGIYTPPLACDECSFKIFYSSMLIKKMHIRFQDREHLWDGCFPELLRKDIANKQRQRQTLFTRQSIARTYALTNTHKHI